VVACAAGVGIPPKLYGSPPMAAGAAGHDPDILRSACPSGDAPPGPSLVTIADQRTCYVRTYVVGPTDMPDGQKLRVIGLKYRAPACWNYNTARR
jgi:hypothetical protein